MPWARSVAGGMNAMAERRCFPMPRNVAADMRDQSRTTKHVGRGRDRMLAEQSAGPKRLNRGPVEAYMKHTGGRR